MNYLFNSFLKKDSQWIIDLSNNETYLNYVDMLISESMRIPVSVDTTSGMLLRVELVSKQAAKETQTSNFYYLSKPRAMISKMPGKIK